MPDSFCLFSTETGFRNPQDKKQYFSNIFYILVQLSIKSMGFIAHVGIGGFVRGKSSLLEHAPGDLNFLF